MEHLAGRLGHADRHAGLRGYCTGLMLPLSRKSVEPMAASVDPLHAGARHQSLHHFVAKAQWSHEEMLSRVAQWVVPRMDLSGGAFWIVDDTGFPKKGKHSVGVARRRAQVDTFLGLGGSGHSQLRSVRKKYGSILMHRQAVCHAGRGVAAMPPSGAA